MSGRICQAGPRIANLATLAACAFVLALPACGEAATPTPLVEKAQSAGIGETLQSEEFEIALLDLPEMRDQVGGNVEGDLTPRFANGMFVVITVQLTNHAEESRILPARVFQVMDEQGRSFKVEHGWIHRDFVWADERWMSDENYIPQNFLDSGATRDGPLIYDIAKDSTGLSLVIEDGDASIDLGF